MCLLHTGFDDRRSLMRKRDSKYDIIRSRSKTTTSIELQSTGKEKFCSDIIVFITLFDSKQNLSIITIVHLLFGVILVRRDFYQSGHKDIPYRYFLDSAELTVEV